MKSPVISVLAALALLASVSAASACSCVRLSREQAVANATLVFEGEVVSVTTQNMQSSAKVQVIAVEKGSAGKFVTVNSHALRAMCGITLKVGEKQVFGGVPQNGRLQASGCIQDILNPR